MKYRLQKILSVIAALLLLIASVTVTTSTRTCACAEAFEQISGFYTTYAYSAEARKHNIQLAASRLDGYVWEPYEILSFNRVVGARTAENGYLAAPIIVGNRFVEGAGGGVCQVSTTLYNACLLADLEPIEVHAHSLRVSYVNPSFDAMVSSAADLKMRNRRGSNILVRAFADGERLRIELWGKPLNYTVSRASVEIRTIPFPTEYVEGATGAVLSEGANGLESRGYLHYGYKGKTIKTAEIRHDLYYPHPRRVERSSDEKQ